MPQNTVPASEATAAQPSRHMRFDIDITDNLVKDVASTIWKTERFSKLPWSEVQVFARELLEHVKEQLKTAEVRERVPAPKPVNERAFDEDPMSLGGAEDFQP